MSEPTGPGAPDHGRHDLELVARAAAGELSASEAMAARDMLAGCEKCAALAADLRAITSATRALPSPRTGAVPARAPRDFRLTERDAARLRRRRPFGLGWTAGAVSRARGLGGALATLGLVGVLVSAGLPGLFAGAGGTAGAPDMDAYQTLSGESPGIRPAATSLSALNASDDGNREATATEDPRAVTGPGPIAIASAGALIIGIVLLLAGRSGRRAER